MDLETIYLAAKKETERGLNYALNTGYDTLRRIRNGELEQVAEEAAIEMGVLGYKVLNWASRGELEKALENYIGSCEISDVTEIE